MNTFLSLDIFLILLGCCAGLSFKRLIASDPNRVGDNEEMEKYKIAKASSVTSHYMCGILCFKQNCKLYSFDKDESSCTMYNSTVKTPAPSENPQVFIEFKTCSNDSTQYGIVCFLLVRTSATWTNAQIKCKELGGTLARSTSSGANEVLTKIARSQGTSVWIGGYKSHGIWKWDQSNENMTFTNWHPGEPNRSGECMQMWASVGWTWDDCHCTAKMPFICESLAK